MRMTLKRSRTAGLLAWLCGWALGGGAIGAPIFGAGQSEATRYLQTSAQQMTAEEFARQTRGAVQLHRSPADGEYRVSGNGVIRQKGAAEPEWIPARGVLPVSPVQIVLRMGPSTVWLGTSRGLIRYSTAAGTTPIRYLAGRRWLPDDRVTGLAVERWDPASGEYTLWVETPTGFSRIEERRMTLSEKARHFEARLRARHVRHGLTADSRLTRPGDLTSNQMVSSDNDGLWTAMYVAAEAYRYRVTRDPEALAAARQGMQALLRLEEISGIPGFPARSFIRKGVDLQPSDGEWHDTPDGVWRWKADTSSDEIVGHYYIYAIYSDLVADDLEKERIRQTVTRVTDHILNNNYQLIDVDGKRTLWGWWGPQTIWEDATETGLRALHILSHLRVAIHLTGNPRYQAAYDDLIRTHRYHLLTRNQKINYPGYINHSDDELAFLSYYPLLRYETDEALRKVYLDSLERAWQVERPERNPLWNFIYAVGRRTSDFDREESLRTLREIPMELVEWNVANSHRADIVRDLLADRFGRAQSLHVLPYDELPMTKWNGNPYRLDGGAAGQREDDGAYFLLPYWMGRFYQLIGE